MITASCQDANEKVLRLVEVNSIPGIHCPLYGREMHMVCALRRSLHAVLVVSCVAICTAAVCTPSTWTLSGHVKLGHNICLIDCDLCFHLSSCSCPRIVLFIHQGISSYLPCDF